MVPPTTALNVTKSALVTETAPLASIVPANATAPCWCMSTVKSVSAPVAPTAPIVSPPAPAVPVSIASDGSPAMASTAGSVTAVPADTPKVAPSPLRSLNVNAPPTVPMSTALLTDVTDTLAPALLIILKLPPVPSVTPPVAVRSAWIVMLPLTWAAGALIDAGVVFAPTAPVQATLTALVTTTLPLASSAPKVASPLLFRLKFTSTSAP